ncbi:hypothetical protein ACHHYP_08126 [Achlya hypogyna]|uniref:Uncharacterized protein n=1 Tax=Achlya hypogyna TaxID=1202772 RepID=A0A1V9YPX8_ACHHY|nr:hypothetical protein ACHHYP_08126 [Achlya hypogyna]
MDAQPQPFKLRKAAKRKLQRRNRLRYLKLQEALQQHAGALELHIAKRHVVRTLSWKDVADELRLGCLESFEENAVLRRRVAHCELVVSKLKATVFQEFGSVAVCDA